MYAIYILPRNPGEISFEETVLILENLFREKTSLFNTRWQCLNLQKKKGGVRITFANSVKGSN